MLFFKKKRKKNEEPLETVDRSLDLETEFSKRKNYKDAQFEEIESLQYVRTQCEQVVESSKYITEVKVEYQAVNAYLTDVQKIDQAEPVVRERLRELAQEAVKLDQKRVKYQKKQSNLPRSKYALFEQYEEDFPKALTNFQNDEKSMQTVKHDLRILEAERVSIKEDIKKYKRRGGQIRNISLISLFACAAVFIIFLFSGQLNTDSGRTLFMIVLLLAAVFVILIFVLQRRSLYRLKLSEKKIARAVTLLNKTKIKYVNIVNSVDYQKAKYKVKNGYQLSHEYELYLMDKKAQERYQNSTIELDSTLAAINDLLRGLHLQDISVWESQLEALVDDREMVEVRHSLNTRRQRLREQIDYNMGRIEEAKKGVVSYIRNHPKQAQAIMEIVDSYDMDMAID